MTRVLAIIPARANSKGLPGKNVRVLCGKPLIVWSIEHALASECVADTVVSTDSPEIAAIASAAGASVPFLRPAELATDGAATEPVMLHAVAEMERDREPYDVIALLQPTSPYRKDGALDRAMGEMEESKSDSLLSVVESHAFFWQKDPVRASYDFRNRPRRQDIRQDDRRFRETGSIYLTARHVLLNDENRLGGKITLFEMDQDESLEIDTMTDFQILDSIMKETLTGL